MIRKAIAAAAVAITAGLVSLINSQPSPTPAEVPAVPITITSTQVSAEGDAGWDCREVTEHSNGVCGSDLPEGFTVADIAECVTPALYQGCAAAVRERLGG